MQDVQWFQCSHIVKLLCKFSNYTLLRLRCNIQTHINSFTNTDSKSNGKYKRNQSQRTGRYKLNWFFRNSIMAIWKVILSIYWSKAHHSFVLLAISGTLFGIYISGWNLDLFLTNQCNCWCLYRLVYAKDDHLIILDSCLTYHINCHGCQIFSSSCFQFHVWGINMVEWPHWWKLSSWYVVWKEVICSSCPEPSYLELESVEKLFV